MFWERCLKSRMPNQEKTEKLLLHICCAPCSTASIERLKNKYDVTGIFCNSNIYPVVEFKKRLEEVKKYCQKMKIDLINVKYDYNNWLERVKGLEAELEGGRRCLKCYEIRLDKVAKTARDKNFDYFTTTLSISPYKNFEEIEKIGERLGKKYEVKFLSRDFKKKDGFKRSIDLSKEHNLYRQYYCGCEFSINE